MTRRRANEPEEAALTRRRPASTPEGREDQVIALAYDLAEKQIREGTASAQVISHFLKAGSRRDRLEQEKIGLEKELLAARADQISSQGRQEELYENAIAAMRQYAGHEEA